MQQDVASEGMVKTRLTLYQAFLCTMGQGGGLATKVIIGKVGFATVNAVAGGTWIVKDSKTKSAVTAISPVREEDQGCDMRPCIADVSVFPTGIDILSH